MLTDRERFKLAFLQRCADNGLTLEQTYETVKQAFLGGLLSGAGNFAGRTASALGRAGLTGALLVPTAAGAATGYMLGSGSGASDEDIEEEKQREIIDAYREAAERARRRNQLAARKQNQPRMIRSLV